MVGNINDDSIAIDVVDDVIILLLIISLGDLGSSSDDDNPISIINSRLIISSPLIFCAILVKTLIDVGIY